MQKPNPKSSSLCSPPDEPVYSLPKKGELWFFANQAVLITDVTIGGLDGQHLIWVLYTSGNKGMFDNMSLQNYIEDKRAWKIA